MCQGNMNSEYENKRRWEEAIQRGTKTIVGLEETKEHRQSKRCALNLKTGSPSIPSDWPQKVAKNLFEVSGHVRKLTASYT